MCRPKHYLSCHLNSDTLHPTSSVHSSTLVEPTLVEPGGLHVARRWVHGGTWPTKKPASSCALQADTEVTYGGDHVVVRLPRASSPIVNVIPNPSGGQGMHQAQVGGSEEREVRVFPPPPATTGGETSVAATAIAIAVVTKPECSLLLYRFTAA